MSRSRMSRSRLAKISHYYFGLFHDSVHKTRTINDHFALTELGPAAAAAHLQSTGGTVLRNMVTARGPVRGISARSHQAAKFSNRRAGPNAGTVVSVEGADQAARKPGAPYRYHGRVASWQGCLCCVWPFVRPGCDHHHCTR